MERRTRSALREPDREPVAGLAAETLPGVRAVDRLAVDREPGAEPLQDRALFVGNGSVGPRTDVEQEVAVLRDDVDEQVDEFLRRTVVLRDAVLVEPEAAGHAAHRLPLRRGDVGLYLELRGREVVVDSRPGGVPAIVHDAVGDGPVVVAEQSFRVAVRRRVDVVPQDRGVIAIDEFAPLLVDEARVFRLRRREPESIEDRRERRLEERPVDTARVVDAHAHAVGAHRVGEFADDVARRMPVLATGVRHGTRPQLVAVVVLGHEHDVARPRRAEQVRPLARLPRVEPVAEDPGEALVGEVGAPGRAVVLPGTAALDRHRVAVPLAVGVMLQEPLDPVRREEVVGTRRVGEDHLRVERAFGPRGNRERPPVDHDPELGVGIPGRQGPGDEVPGPGTDGRHRRLRITGGCGRVRPDVAARGQEEGDEESRKPFRDRHARNLHESHGRRRAIFAQPCLGTRAGATPVRRRAPGDSVRAGPRDRAA